MESLREAHAKEYSSENEYLKAMFEVVVDLLSYRDSWGVGIKWKDGTTPYGPFFNKTTANKYGSRMAAVLKGQVFLQQLQAPSKLKNPEENTSE